MNKLEIFEPVMCCSSGGCGSSVDENQMLITSVINALNTIDGYQAYQYNLTDNPVQFVSNETVSTILQKENTAASPITVLNGKVKKAGAYPTLDEIAEYTGVRFMVTDQSGESDCGSTGCC